MAAFSDRHPAAKLADNAVGYLDTYRMERDATRLDLFALAVFAVFLLAHAMLA